MAGCRLDALFNPYANTMITFTVNDMTCGHCVGSITNAVKAADPGAQVRADVATHRVQIDSASTSAATLAAAIAEAGYTPVAVDNG